LAAGGRLRAELPTREEVLALVYPGAEFHPRHLFLTGEQMQAVRSAAGEGFPSPLVARYDAVKEGRLIGRAYVDTHLVRTKNQSLLICLDGEGAVLRVETTAFMEPPEYQVPQAWLAQYRGRVLTPDLHLHRRIRPIAGATLTAAAATRAVRRVLALDSLLQQPEGNEK
jgi:hypothetical protein